MNLNGLKIRVSQGLCSLRGPREESELGSRGHLHPLPSCLFLLQSHQCSIFRALSDFEPSLPRPPLPL